MDFERPVLILFGIGIFGAIFFMVVLAFLTHSKSRNQRIAALLAKKADTEEELIEISVKQVHCLNSMLAYGSISPLNYDLELLKILKTFKVHGFDSAIILSIPRPQPPQLKEMLNRTMIISNELSNSGEISDEEFNNVINKSLDY